MTRLVLLDAGPLGMITNPRASDQTRTANVWLRTVLDGGARVRVPEISDYEVRRELLRAGKVQGLARLDSLAAVVGYVPITTEVMRKAAEFWAAVRQSGRPTASDDALDSDVILAAQAALAGDPGDEIIVATTNVAHLSRFVDARLWQDIR